MQFPPPSLLFAKPSYPRFVSLSFMLFSSGAHRRPHMVHNNIKSSSAYGHKTTTEDVAEAGCCCRLSLSIGECYAMIANRIYGNDTRHARNVLQNFHYVSSLINADGGGLNGIYRELIERRFFGNCIYQPVAQTMR